MIHLKNVFKNYEGKAVLQDVSMTIHAGKINALMAPSGSGKTTLLRLLLQLEEADAGQIEGVEGRKIGVLFQEDRLIEELSASGNIRLVNEKLTEEQVAWELSQMGLKGVEAQPVSTFSGGMKRRVALLRALLYNADILLLDEPFKGLDEKTKSLVMVRTKELCEGRCVLLITHDQQEAMAMGDVILKNPAGFRR